MPHVIKLHFRKDERLTKDKVCAIVNLMEEELMPHLPDDVIFGVLEGSTLGQISLNVGLSAKSLSEKP
jgi:hypothetical protein